MLCVFFLCSQASQFFQLIFTLTGPSSQLEDKVCSQVVEGALTALRLTPCLLMPRSWEEGESLLLVSMDVAGRI